METLKLPRGVFLIIVSSSFVLQVHYLKYFRNIDLFADVNTGLEPTKPMSRDKAEALQSVQALQ